MNVISFKISKEMLMEMAALKTPEDRFEYIEDCFAIDKNRIENVQTIYEPLFEPVLNITIKKKMPDNKKIIYDEFESLKGQFVIAGDWKVKRLVGVVGDDMGYYWLFYDGREFSLDTCLCRIVPLKGKIADKDYDEFVRIAYLNHLDIVSYEKDDSYNFCELHKEEIVLNLLKDQEHKNSLLTEICWELN